MFSECQIKEKYLIDQVSFFSFFKFAKKFIQKMSYQEDDNQEDCTVYIEELKSDNAQLRLKAAQKLQIIGATLGHNRIRDELIPYLIEIIQEMDNQNDFLIKMAEGLLELKGCCKSIDESFILISPLKILASLDQPSVREKAVEALKQLAADQNFSFFKKHFFPLIQQLSDPAAQYSPRVSACSLISTCYPNLQADKQQELNKIFKRLGQYDDNPLVRRAIVQNFEGYTRVVSKNISKVDLYEIWEVLIKDKIDIIKIKALENAHILARFHKKQDIYEKLLKHIKVVDPNKKSWRIRYALAECLSKKQVIKKDVVEMFEELLKDNQVEVRCITLLKTPQVAQKLSKQHSYTVFFQYFEKACQDPNINVKLAVVQVIVAYLTTLQKEKVIENGIPLIQSLLKDDHPSVRSGVVQRIKNLHGVLEDQGTQKYLIPIIEGCLNDKKWRFKLALAESIAGLFKQLGYEKYKDFINKVLNAFIKDHYFSVREATIKCLVQLKSFFGGDKTFQIIQNMMKTLIEDKNYVYRSTACWLFNYSSQCLEKKQLNQLFLELCKKLEGEKVPNVLITFLAEYPKFKVNLNSQSKKQFQLLVKKIRDQKDDEDVLYYISKADE